MLKITKINIIYLISIIIINVLTITNAYEVIYAINAGGNEHVDRDGIRFDRDPLMNKIGTASDYGKHLLMIGRVPQSDEVIYQTERYHTGTFGYDIPISGDGDYVLILKFCEVYFSAPNMKVFDVALNGDHTVIADLDIYQQVGKGTAHDEYIYFSISRGRLYYKEEESDIRGGKIRVEFIKGYRDNPKINAIALLKGIENIPMLPSLQSEAELSQQQQQQQQQAQQQHHQQYDPPPSAQQGIPGLHQDEKLQNSKIRKTSGPKQPNPYSLDDSSVMLPVFIAIGAFIPLLFCLCKL